MPRFQPRERALLSIYAAVRAYTNHVNEKHIKPFCDKYNLRFKSGMGTYVFVDKQGIIEDAPLLVGLLDDDLDGVLTHCVGSSCNDYTPPNFNGVSD